MLDFLNWFFSFFLSFIDCLSRFTITGTVSLGILIVSAMLFLIVGRFLIGYWRRKSIDDGGDNDG